MPIQDRSTEFRACVDSIRNRSAVGRRSDVKQRLLQGRTSGAKSDVSRMATAIGKDISTTSLKLGKLGQRECSPPHPISACLLSACQRHAADTSLCHCSCEAQDSV